MRKLNVPIINGNVTEDIYEIKELSYLGKMLSCKESKKRGISYLEIPCAFDIETTNITQPLDPSKFSMIKKSMIISELLKSGTLTK